MHITSKTACSELQAVSRFYYPALNAKFYFTKDTATQFQKFFNLCHEVADLARVERTTSELEETTRKIECALNIANQLENDIIEKITIP